MKKMGYENVCFEENSVFLVTGGAGFIGSNLCEAIKKGKRAGTTEDIQSKSPSLAATKLS